MFGITRTHAAQLANDQFTNGLDGYSGNGISWYQPDGGWIDIDRDKKATKTYNFGSSYSNTTVTIDFKIWANDKWDNSDRFEVWINNSKMGSYKIKNGGTKIKSISAQTDSNGKLKVRFTPNTDKNNEYGAVDYVIINAYTPTVWITNTSGTSAYTSPSPYTNNSDADTTLSIAGADQLEVTISGNTEYESNCGYDYVTITDSAGNTSQRYCGSINDTFTADGPTVTLHFHSDPSVVDSGVTVSIAQAVANANNDEYTVMPDTSLSVNAANGLLANDSGSNIQVTSATQPAHGTLTFNTDGSFVYTPDPGYTGDDSFNYTITDSVGNTDTATVSLHVEINTNYTENFGFELINPPNTRNIIGGYTIAGNTVLCLTNKTTGYATSESECVDTTVNGSNGERTSNKYVAKYIDIDNNNSTWNSSSSNITLPNSYDRQGGAGILWAGLIWQGRFVWSGGRENLHYHVENGNTYTTVETGDDVSNPPAVTLTDANANHIRLKVDNGTYHQATAFKVYSESSSGGITYTALADVTSILRAENLAKGKHTFTVANLPTEEGREHSPGIYGGWSLVVIYAEDFNGKPRNISIYGGMDHLKSKNNATPIQISGFKLPSSGNSVSAQLSIFSGEGELPYSPDGVDIGLSNTGPWTPMPGTGGGVDVFDALMQNIDRDNITGHANNLTNNNVGLDVDNFDLGNIISGYPRSTTSFYLRWWSNGDYIIPGMIAFSTELYRPSLCYDYTLDIDGFVIPSTDNQIRTNLGAFTNKPLTTRVTVRSRESDFVLHDVNVTYRVADINQTYYISGTTAVAPDGIFSYTPATSQTYNESPHGFGMYIGQGAGPGHGGSIGELQTTYFKFNNDLNRSNVDTSFTLRAQYTVDYGSGPVPQFTNFTQDQICNDISGYYPAEGIFNVTSAEADDNTGKPYNLYTQVADRAFSAKIFSLNNLDKSTPENVTTGIEVELFNAGLFTRDTNLTCNNPDSNITQPIYIRFNDEHNVTIDSQSFNIAMRNAGFRTWHLTEPDGSILEHNCTSRTDTNCFQDIYTTVYTSDSNCTSECATPIPGTDTCYYCLRKFYGQPTCSRDNFAIRPDAFVVKLYDSDQNASVLPSNPTNTKYLAHTRNPADSTLSNSANLAAGYKYRYDIAATNFLNDTPVPKYIRTFDAANTASSSISSMQWNPTRITTGCNDIANKPIDMTIYDGTNKNSLTGQAMLKSIDQIGEYSYIIKDQNWTSADWDPNLMSHHTGLPNWNTGSSFTDCQKDSNRTYDTSYTGIQGCETTNVHTNPQGWSYLTLDARFYPYTFNLDATTIGAGPSNSNINNAPIYINTLDQNLTYPQGYYYSVPGIPSTIQDEDMSYNIQGTIRAVDYGGNNVSNFVKNCYADPVDMNISHIYFTPIPTIEANLTYDLIDFNTSNPGDIIRPRSQQPVAAPSTVNTPTPIVIRQNANDFRKDMEGTVTMDLGFNFRRQMNRPLNPRGIRFGDFIVQYSGAQTIAVDTNISKEIKGVKDNNQTVFFYYGRVKPSKLFYQDITAPSVVTPIIIETYCDSITLGVTECNNRGLLVKSNDLTWWKSVYHNSTNGHGVVGLNVGIPIEGAGTPTISTQNVPITSGDNTTLYISRGANPTLPMTVPVNIMLLPNPNYTDRWLLYNEYNNSVPTPATLYKVRFIGQQGWVGHGDTGNVVQGASNDAKNQRLGW